MQPVLLISEEAVASLTDAAARSHPDETGGILVGVYVDRNPWVTQVIEITSPDRGHHYYRIPGGATQPAVNASRGADSRLGYLGDWHSHPADVGPSPADLASLALISYRRPRRPNPTTIVARNRGDQYVLDARRIVGVQVRHCTLRITGSLKPAHEEEQ